MLETNGLQHVQAGFATKFDVQDDQVRLVLGYEQKRISRAVRANHHIAALSQFLGIEHAHVRFIVNDQNGSHIHLLDRCVAYSMISTLLERIP